MVHGDGRKAARERRGRICPLVFALAVSVALTWLPSVFAADKLMVGVAASFIVPFQEMAQEFEQESGVKIEATYTSSGNLYGQIINGAPYDLFLSADEVRPKILFDKGLAERPFTYARGRVVLWTLQVDLCRGGNWRETLMMPNLKRVAIANPETAPYGAASAAALKAAGLWSAFEPRLVYAQTVAQAFQYAHTGAVDAGFCAFSSTFSDEGRRGCFHFVDEAPEVVQGACILRRSLHPDVAARFGRYLLSGQAEGIKRKYGYE